MLPFVFNPLQNREDEKKSLEFEETENNLLKEARAWIRVISEDEL